MIEAPPRIKFKAKANTTDNQMRKNFNANDGKYKFVGGGIGNKPPCVLAGGGPSLTYALDLLRKWDGDIFAVNDTAGYLSDNGIPCYLFAIDASAIPFKRGPLVKGAVLATRCNPIQFEPYNDIRVFNMLEDGREYGVEGGKTAVTRAPHLFLRMGYQKIVFVGCDGSMSLNGKSHASGHQEIAFKDKMIVRAGDVDYISNISFYAQNDFLHRKILKHPKFLINASGGMLRGMIEYPDSWWVVAVDDHLKKKYIESGFKFWNKAYVGGNKIWQPQAI